MGALFNLYIFTLYFSSSEKDTTLSLTKFTKPVAQVFEPMQCLQTAPGDTWHAITDLHATVLDDLKPCHGPPTRSP